MDFGQALLTMKHGNKVARVGWNGKGMWLKMMEGGEHILVGEDYFQHTPYIALKTADGYLTPWNASQADAIAEDWEIVQ